MFICDMWPKNIIDFEKYYSYVDISRCVEKILREMENTRFSEWKIHKELKAAKIAYVAIARGEGRSRTVLENICTLMAAGYDVRPMRAADISTIRRAAWTLRDKDILSKDAYERANDFCTTCLGDWVYKERVDHQPMTIRTTSNPYGDHLLQLHLYSQIFK